MSDLELIASTITAATGRAFKVTTQRSVGGGCINTTTCLSDGHRCFLLKANSREFSANFHVEIQGLAALAATGTIRVPRVIADIQSDTQAYLILEYIEQRPPTANSWQRLGEQLAALHAQPQEYFGWPCDNFIGATVQPNTRHATWSEFFRTERLEHQFRLCREQGITFIDTDRFLQTSAAALEDHRPVASLLHGDLWSGNVAFDTQGQPFIFDPACYCGDRETDLAFSEFFGGFAPEFYAAYQSNLPLDKGYARRKQFYNLYHCLNHALLFGGSYIAQARAIMQRVLSE